jgi:peptidoglycan/LPS O-acetylase OafA/YrhL
MAFIIGAVVGMYLISSLVAVIAFKKFEKPRKQLYSIPVAWILATILAGYGMADSGEPKFVYAAINYGIASIILIAIHLAVYFTQKARTVNK